jgi:hypothetical protein
MNLTEKGRVAFDYARKYFSEGWFSAAELSERCGEKIAAATLNGIVSRGYMEKMAGTPVKFSLAENIDNLISVEAEAKKGCDNTNLGRARNAKNDEFYTRLEDINAEVIKYKKHFKGKSVLCNCNDGLNSNFFKFFLKNFDVFQLTRLVGIAYQSTGEAVKYVVEDDINGDGYIDEQDIVSYPLADGSFNSSDSLEELERCDIVCTNPPFSVFREYVALLMLYNKKFLIIGSKNAITYKEFFPLLKEDKVWIGTQNVGNFIQPDGSVAKFGNIGWYTNIPHNKRAEPILLTATYHNDTNKREEYPKYDNYNAIEVGKVVNIPKDYFGVMGVPITFLDKYCPEQFEILGHTASCDISPQVEELRTDPEYRNRGRINGKEKYDRVLIRRR